MHSFINFHFHERKALNFIKLLIICFSTGKERSHIMPEEALQAFLPKFIHSYMYLFIYLFTYLFIYLFVYSFIYLCILLFIYLHFHEKKALKFRYMFSGEKKSHIMPEKAFKLFFFQNSFIYLFIYLFAFSLKKRGRFEF